MKISSSFDGGSIDVVSLNEAENIQLKLRSDNQADFMQWFYFRLQGAAYLPCKMSFLNAGQASYAAGWEDYSAVASYDRVNWFRVPTHFDGETMMIEHTPLADSVYYAYFEPYSYEQHLNLIGQAQGSGLCCLRDLGNTIQGRDINLLIIGNQVQSDLKIWVIARQHPGETMAEWFMEGFLSRLLDAQDATARLLLDKATFYVVPNMNPDGGVLGNLRTNAAGANLNREWMEPSIATSPEVYYVRKYMQQTGVDLFLDIHGDEKLPYVFLDGSEGTPAYNKHISQLEHDFKQAFLLANPDFQDEFGYKKDEPGQANLTVATNYVANEFKCLAYTLEMPFKDNNNLPDSDFGWNGQRSLRLGETILSPILTVIDKLRAK